MLVVFARVVLLSVRLHSCNYVGLGAGRSCRPTGREVYSRSAWRHDNLLYRPLLLARARVIMTQNCGFREAQKRRLHEPAEL